MSTVNKQTLDTRTREEIRVLAAETESLMLAALDSGIEKV